MYCETPELECRKCFSIPKIRMTNGAFRYFVIYPTKVFHVGVFFSGIIKYLEIKLFFHMQ